MSRRPRVQISFSLSFSSRKIPTRGGININNDVVSCGITLVRNGIRGKSRRGKEIGDREGVLIFGDSKERERENVGI